MALSSSEHLDEADKKLEAMGYKPVFKREFSSWSTFSFAMSISGIYGSLISTWVYGLQAGGAAAIMWSWIVGGAGALALAVSLAELSSAYPNAGAMYYTLRFLAPEKHMPLLCWMSGWITLIGTIAGSASTEYATSQMLLGAISIATNSTYKPTVGHVVGAMALLTLIHAGINTLPTLWLTRLTSSYVVLHMTVLVSACVYLLVQTKNKNSLAYAFTDFQPTSGWSPPGFAILFGCLTPAWIMTSADSTARIAEEAKSPALTIPRAIFVASLSTYILGFVFNLVLVLCMGPGGPFPLLNSPSGQPVVELFTQALGRAPAIFFTLCGVIIMNMVAIPGAQAGSRMVFALARDELVPLARMWTRVDVKRGTPILAVWGEPEI
ncbi:uncharacterized protein CTHT_0055870 [Thermochaetoides thermophila DSM 1495]|uniref:Amino acid permease-like protein n=1 Tax=Chaetomium thermophilum (strain DSM 1495 / CBS 144.50 / IMI 039719) TaxID=759272 RepID=G0SC44_CHATD|nr:hypothetical protein CTHT_0055870 [Thermochaetoides thermophila DSM 1495]EGS18970.1 hypothetical protein CTHT_0055870 [Thermochaetoides thermophila DSM 1495]